MSDMKFVSSNLDGLSPQNDEVLGSLHHEAREFVTQDTLNLIGLFDFDADASSGWFVDEAGAISNQADTQRRLATATQVYASKSLSDATSGG